MGLIIIINLIINKVVNSNGQTIPPLIMLTGHQENQTMREMAKIVVHILHGMENGTTTHVLKVKN